MTVTKPAGKPARPYFSSGPCAKPPGWEASKLKTESLGRSHRAKIGKSRLQLAIDLPYAQPAALAQPQRVLQQDDESNQDQDRPAHRTGIRLEN